MPRYKFEEIAVNSTEKRKPTVADTDTYIGLEHLDSGRIFVSRWGSKVDLVGDKLTMRKGDVLFARRNAYLKRAAIAPFDGLFSAHGMVLRPRTEVISERLFPFLISSEAFFREAIRISVGSISPTVNWRELKEIEFLIPSLDEQDKLSELFWSITEAQKAYDALMASTEALVKSQFIEVFGPYSKNIVQAGSMMIDMRNGVSASKNGVHRAKLLTLSAITQGAFDATSWKEGLFDCIPPASKCISRSDFYICRGNGNKSLVGTGVFSSKDYADLVFPDTVIAAHVDAKKVRLPYLACAWKQPFVRNQIEDKARTTNGIYKINQSIISNIEIILPPLHVQLEFERFLEQLDKSKFALQHNLERLEMCRNALMQKAFG